MRFDALLEKSVLSAPFVSSAPSSATGFGGGGAHGARLSVSFATHSAYAGLDSVTDSAMNSGTV